MFPRLAGRLASVTCSPHCFPVFPRLAPVASFPALSTGYKFFCAWYRLHIFPRLAPVASFPALCTGYKFFCAWHRLHIFPRIAPVALIFSRACHRLDLWIFSVRTVTYVADMFRAWHRLVVLFPFAHPNISVWTSKWHSFGFEFVAVIKKNHNPLAFQMVRQNTKGQHPSFIRTLFSLYWL